jgi:methionyl-tRNA formyltransferase
MKIIFFGSDDFAAVHLEKLLSSKHQILAAVTGIDKPQGRGMKMMFSPIKQLAIDAKIPCLQPSSLKDKNIVDELRNYQADIFVVVAYGRLLTESILDIPKMLCINVHGSLLPHYRGAAPINWAILNRDKETGVTLQKMVLKLDAGDIIAQKVIPIAEGEDAQELRLRMSQIGAQLLINTLEQHPLGNFSFTPQDESIVTQAPKLSKEMGKIDWSKSVYDIEAQVRGLQIWPGAYTSFNGKHLKITKTKITDEVSREYSEGQVSRIDKNGFYVVCRDKVLLIKEVQPEAGKLMPAASFVAGYKVVPGFAFGI